MEKTIQLIAAWCKDKAKYDAEYVPLCDVQLWRYMPKSVIYMVAELLVDVQAIPMPLGDLLDCHNLVGK